MRRTLVVTAAAAVALTACARSEPAETDFNQIRVDEPAPMLNDAGPDLAQTPTTDLPVAAALRQALAASGGIGADAKWLVGRADLNGDGKDEALAYVIETATCGTGGCSLYVLSDNGTNGWQVIDKIGPAQLPLYVLSPGGADGWATLGVTVGGGGAERALMAVPHSAEGYLDNPTAAPAKKAEPGSAKPLIDGDMAKAVPIPSDDPAPVPAAAPQG